jgi:hypothetical protein
VTPQEYAVRAVRAWIENLEFTTVPELKNQPGETFTLFVEQVLDAAQGMVGDVAYAIISERQDEEWQHFNRTVALGGLEDGPYPVRFTGKGEVVR